jgi:hypothetical protein
MSHHIDISEIDNMSQAAETNIIRETEKVQRITYGNCNSSLFHSGRPRHECISWIVLQVVLLLPVLSNIAVYSCHCHESITLVTKFNQHTFDWLLSIIPTRSNKPTAYLPKFLLLCVPEMPLNPITSALNFHFFSLTSI